MTWSAAACGRWLWPLNTPPDQRPRGCRDDAARSGQVLLQPGRDRTGPSRPVDSEVTGQTGESVVIALSDRADLPRRGPPVELEQHHRAFGRQGRYDENERGVALEADVQAGDVGEGAAVDARADGDGGDAVGDRRQINLQLLE